MYNGCGEPASGSCFPLQPAVALPQAFPPSPTPPHPRPGKTSLDDLNLLHRHFFMVFYLILLKSHAEVDIGSHFSKEGLGIPRE